MEEFFIALVPITFILSLAGVLIFRPLTKRLGNVMEANALGKRDAAQERLQYESLKALVDAQNLKIDHLKRRLEFAEGLLESRTARVLGGASVAGKELT
jgi:hypothetical protein